MARLTIATEALLLTRRQSGEHGLLLILLSRTHGLIKAFKRIPSKGSHSPPDLFDEASVNLEKPPGGDLWFVSEYIVQKRRPGIGTDYFSFHYACRYAILLSHHLFEADEAACLTDQLERALDAWETGIRPEAAYFKALYMFARLQGIPVNEEWIKSKTGEQPDQILTILRQPLKSQTTNKDAVDALIADFESYLRHSHEARFDA